MTTTTLSGEAAEKALKESMLDIQIAGLHPKAVGFYAAHGRDHSYLALATVEPRDITVWELTDAPREFREQMAEGIRQSLNREYQGRWVRSSPEVPSFQTSSTRMDV